MDDRAAQRTDDGPEGRGTRRQGRHALTEHGAQPAPPLPTALDGAVLRPTPPGHEPDRSAARAPRRTAGPRRLRRADAAPQPPRAALPDPTPVARDLARCVVEILAGARELDQIARWVTDDVHRHLQVRVRLAARARSVRRTAPRRPVFSIGSVIVREPSDGVAEATVIVHARARTRAVAIRLEGRDGRWRATAVSVL
ncbi:Rv3235 family protein [Curtobacterium sp. MCBD17_028]|uniref:Rv3235 family protein n=1 Tax=Curtobacterium sp. MCBD17_028 TaxID=2175670 RepID=UPI001C6463E1|nr:Rv3235 family protein [Curtobacterium sp. MCBD17_028]